MGFLTPQYLRDAPLVRRRIRLFFANGESADEVLLDFFERQSQGGPRGAEAVWALATKHCLRRVRDSDRRDLLVSPLPSDSWAAQSGAGEAPGMRALAHGWRSESPVMLEVLVYAEVDGMSASQIADVMGKPRGWVADLVRARSSTLGA